jgi:23S rRNA (uracil1939-C5)-methyltransferase
MLPSLIAMGATLAIVDPPRAGLHRKALDLLVNEGPQTLLYVSCNPEALARDLSLLKDDYEVKRVEVVDLFPHTEHVETAVWLERLG